MVQNPNLEKDTMKKIFSALLILTCMSVLSFCRSEEKKQPPKQEFQPNSDIRTFEVGMVKEGDKRIKAEAVLGTPSVELNTQDGAVLEWYLVSTDYQKNSYKTLAEKPAAITEDTKFIKLTIDKKGVIKKMEYKL
ncbi:LIC13410 family lipoprotein [Leptospira kmetyi]|uniref:Lipoprotein n=1 Tax=Leptospira kmetyi TaxID=408139 RepID=A0A2M9XNX7_9LEPT|nr:hypothetical protein [Leptospira kmetyi]AYV55917.1 hypothetical protein EFP84_10610 [Leptospira kmetyi]EQA52494.1 hypothetical protein LEP1GSC052_3507 [Leptospira kmetyi serovar Malaysia str. Bejo-Iso9]PJZ27739.1 hypothetical protein CH378_21510 [Leptospira kmetyi]PJZ41011.1 hypothetical protein CH370_12215 [Leptospira kmetyi]TGK16271.1 hypothetical protein EHO62_11010 [Leptospira kmetyi]